MIEKTIDIDRMEQAVQLFGSFDENIKELEKEYGVTILSRGTDIKVSGDAEGVYNACKAIDALLSLVEKGEVINDQRVRYVMDLVRDGSSEQVAKIAGDVICITAKGRPLKPKTLGQKKYVESHPHRTRSSWASARRAPVRPIWRWQWRYRPSGPMRSTASFSPVPPWRRARSWASCRVTCRTRSIPICGRSTMRCLICWERRTFQKYLETGQH